MTALEKFVFRARFGFVSTSMTLPTTSVSARRRFARALAATAVAAGVTLVGATPARADAPPEQAGSLMLGAGMGPIFALSGFGATAFNLNFTGGYAFNDHLYGVFTPHFSFGGGGAVIALPLGLQYDIPIEKVPGLYVYPRFSIGAAFATGPGGQAAFLITPEAGVKYNIQDKFFVGFEPFSLPIAISSATTVFYRINFNGGIYL